MNYVRMYTYNLKKYEMHIMHSYFVATKTAMGTMALMVASSVTQQFCCVVKVSMLFFLCSCNYSSWENHHDPPLCQTDIGQPFLVVFQNHTPNQFAVYFLWILIHSWCQTVLNKYIINRK